MSYWEYVFGRYNMGFLLGIAIGSKGNVKDIGWTVAAILMYAALEKVLDYVFDDEIY